MIPTNLRFCILTWYHENLLHPGADQMFHTISQHFTWPSLRTQVENFVKHCNTCQHYKAKRKKYGHIPVPDKQQIANPWHSIAVDTIGPWIIPQSPHSSKSKEPTTLQALTIIDLNTHFMEIVALKIKECITVARSLNQIWLCCYPRPVDCLHDNGREFVSAEFQELLQSYGIRSKLTTVKNPQANGILERTHQVIGNLLRSSHLIAQDLDTVSTQQELLMPVMWAINTTFHTALKASPDQLAFSHDMILPTSFAANWYAINSRKQAQSQSAANAKNCNAFHMNSASTTKFSSIVTLAIHIWVNWPSLLKVPSKLLTYNNSQSMVPFLYSDHRLLFSASTFDDCCHFLMLQLRTQMLYLSHYDLVTHAYFHT
jgi:hypothetical protein